MSQCIKEPIKWPLLPAKVLFSIVFLVCVEGEGGGGLWGGGGVGRCKVLFIYLVLL